MSTKYQKGFGLPENFSSVLKDFTREVLRAQPENIAEFAANYFTELADSSQTKEAKAEESEPISSPDDQIKELVRQLLQRYDVDGSGSLDFQEFLTMGADAGWPEQYAASVFEQLRLICDRDNSGCLDKDELRAWLS
eukprot:TRINITY_DN567_c0_g1_i1.p1 TRINITY_DN567_c0_g1~~TRINITY_DN567_c0_g1_i1.p1  ORF type:complete len:156 (+),score=53.53 TRINITY_DN567_c0_g1_i1:59-469(+)